MKNLVLNLLLFLASLCVAVVLGEVLVRICSPQVLYAYRDINRPDSLLIYRHRENANMMVDVGEGPVRFLTDDEGHRINSDDGESSGRSEADVSILTVGDSFVAALAVENQNSVSGILASLLSSKYEKTVNAVNAGVSGWSPNQYYLETRRSLSLRNYDLGLVFLYAGNDCIDKVDTAFTSTRYRPPPRLRFPQKLSKDELKDSIYHPLFGILGKRLQLAVFLDYRLRVLLSRLGLTRYYHQRQQNLQVFSIAEENSKRWGTVADICQGIAREFGCHDVPVLFILLPTDFQVYEDKFYDDLDRFDLEVNSVDLEQPNRKLGHEFIERSLHLIDLVDCLR